MFFSLTSKQLYHCSFLTIHVSIVLLALLLCFLPVRYCLTPCGETKWNFDQTSRFSFAELLQGGAYSRIRTAGEDRGRLESLSGLLMSYKLENTDSSRTSLCSPSKEWEGIWLRWWAQAFPEHGLKQRLLDRVTIKLPTAVMALSYKSSVCPCFVCTPTKWWPERSHGQKELSSPEADLPCTRFLNTVFTLGVVQHQFLVANTSVLFLQDNTVMCHAVEISVIKTPSIL